MFNNEVETTTLVTEVQTIATSIQRNVAHELFASLLRNDSVNVWDTDVLSYVCGHITESTQSMFTGVILRVNAPVEVLQVPDFICGKSVNGHAFRTLRMREVVSFALTRLKEVTAGSNIVCVTPICRDKTEFYLLQFGARQNYDPRRFLGKVPGRMTIPAGTLYLARQD